MENQHRAITGYRDLTEDEVAMMNEVKRVASEVGETVEDMEANASALGLDPRWIAIAKTNLQQGFMALTRAVARPETF